MAVRYQAADEHVFLFQHFSDRSSASDHKQQSTVKKVPAPKKSSAMLALPPEYEVAKGNELTFLIHLFKIGHNHL